MSCNRAFLDNLIAGYSRGLLFTNEYNWYNLRVRIGFKLLSRSLVDETRDYENVLIWLHYVQVDSLKKLL